MGIPGLGCDANSPRRTRPDPKRQERPWIAQKAFKHWSKKLSRELTAISRALGIGVE
jgi:hypothetical protein